MAGSTIDDSRTRLIMPGFNIDDSRTRLIMPGRFNSNDFAPRCGSTIQVIVADLLGQRRSHPFIPTMSLAEFRERLAASRGIEFSQLILVHRGTILGGDATRSLLALGLVDGSTVHAFPKAQHTPILRGAELPAVTNLSISRAELASS